MVNRAGGSTEPPTGRRSVRSATQADMAEALGISQSTVSKALRGDPLIPHSLRERAAAMAEALGYSKVTTGPGWPKVVSLVKGLGVSDDAFWALARHLSADARNQGMAVRIDAMEHLRRLALQACSEAIVFVGNAPPELGDVGVVRLLARAKRPAVLVSLSPMKGRVTGRVAVVLLDTRAGLDLVLEALRALGHTRIACASRPSGYEASLRSHGLHDVIVSRPRPSDRGLLRPEAGDSPSSGGDVAALVSAGLCMGASALLARDDTEAFATRALLAKGQKTIADGGAGAEVDAEVQAEVQAEVYAEADVGASAGPCTGVTVASLFGVAGRSRPLPLLLSAMYDVDGLAEAIVNSLRSAEHGSAGDGGEPIVVTPHLPTTCSNS